MTGDMPNGHMSMERYSPGEAPCSGYEQYGTICITYNFPSGTRDNIRYSGTTRHAYLPDSPEGNEVLRLL